MALTVFYALGLSILAVALIASALARKADIVKRCLILIVLLHAVCAAMLLGSGAFAVLMLLVAGIGGMELSLRSGGGRLRAVPVVCAVFLAAKASETVLYALIAVGFALMAFLLLRRRRNVRPAAEAWIYALGLVAPCAAALSAAFDRGAGHAVAMILFVQFNDTAAYFAGKRFGARHAGWLSRLSPNKTLEGYAGGAVGVLVAAVLLHSAIPVYPIEGSAFRTVLLSAVAFIFANGGDLAFSSIKRRFGMKDFSGILSAHGGVLDRFDSLLCLAPAYLLLMNGGLV